MILHPHLVGVSSIALAACTTFVIASCNGDTSEAGGKTDADTNSPVSRGLLAVQRRACADCHQSPGPNAGVLSGQTAPRPGTLTYGPNLTPDPDTGRDAWDADTFANAIRKGVDDQGQDLCAIMPRFTTMSDEEANDIARYLQSLVPVWHPVPESVCPGNKLEAGPPDARD